MRHAPLLGLLFILHACNDSSTGPDPAPDSGLIDSGGTDSRVADAGGADTAVPPDAALDAGLDAFVPDDLVLEEGRAPIDVPEGTFFTTVSYGESVEQVFDALLPEATEPTPAIIFIHGGGFTGGTRRTGYATPADVERYLEAGVAYFTIDYSLLVTGEEVGVLRSLRDAQRMLQFVRYYADTFNIDPARIALRGPSAGAGTSLWLAFHDDLADPESDDPIARQTTRVVAAVGTATQSTYDLVRWPSDVYTPTYPLTVQDFFANRDLATSAVMFYGLDPALAGDPLALEAELNTPALETYRAEVDMVAWMSNDDPPFWVRNQGRDRAPSDPRFDVLHHPLHAALLEDRAREVSLSEFVVEAPDLEIGGDSDPVDFLLRHLGVE
ncbi:MAG: alpha/beta hydrolase fold domain-containing protein [Myxococcota bacterium]